jgi:hypothetical protein
VSTPRVLPRSAEGIELRRLMPSDLRAFQSYRQDAEIGRFQGWQAMSDAEALAFLLEMNNVALLQQVIAITDARNVPSMRLQGCVGMTHMQTHAAIFRGESCREHHYRLTRPEQRA